MERLGVETLDRIRLAGAFGAHIDVMYATVLGMIPVCDLTKVTSAGNAAGTGARIALLDSRSRQTIESLVGRVEAWRLLLETIYDATRKAPSPPATLPLKERDRGGDAFGTDIPQLLSSSLAAFAFGPEAGCPAYDAGQVCARNWSAPDR